MSVLVFVWCRGYFIKVTEANKPLVFALGHRMSSSCVIGQGQTLPGCQAVGEIRRTQSCGPRAVVLPRGLFVVVCFLFAYVRICLHFATNPYCSKVQSFISLLCVQVCICECHSTRGDQRRT